MERDIVKDRFNRTGILLALAIIMAVLLYWVFQGDDQLGESSIPPVIERSPLKQQQNVDVESHESEQISSILIRFSPSNNRELAYSVSLNGKAEVDYSRVMEKAFKSSYTRPSGQPPEMTVIPLGLSARLHLKFYAVENRSDRWHVAAKLEDLDYSVAGNSLGDNYNMEMLQAVFSFDFTDKGFIDNYRFMEGVDEASQRQLKAVLSSMQIAVPEKAKRKWAMKELDEQGLYKSHYTIVGQNQNSIELDKTKIQYLSIEQNFLKQAVGMEEQQVNINNSTGRIAIQKVAPRDWIERIESDVQTETVVGVDKIGIGRTQFRANKIAVRSGVFPDSYQEFLALLSSDQLLINKYTATDPQINLLGKGHNIHSALELFQQIGKENHFAAKQFLLNYLRQYPQQSYALVDLLDKHSDQSGLSDAEQKKLWYYLALVGHDDAQQALSNAFTQEHFSDATQMRALASVHEIEYPKPFVVDALDALYQSKRSSSEQGGVMAIYAMGSLGNNEKLNSEIPDMTAGILTRELGNTSGKEKRTVLQAIGNHGGELLLPAVESELSSDDDEIREAAFESMRRMDFPQAQNVLLGHLEREEDKDVRFQAIKSLTQMPPQEETMEWARNQALEVSDPREQMVLVQLLGENVEQFSSNEPYLRDLVKQKGVPIEIKKLIYKYIKP